MTPLQFAVLEYLNDKMEANSSVIGRHLERENMKYPWVQTGKGTASVVLGILHRKRYVTYLRDLMSWRITAEGRRAYNGGKK